MYVYVCVYVSDGETYAGAEVLARMLTHSRNTLQHMYTYIYVFIDLKYLCTPWREGLLPGVHMSLFIFVCACICLCMCTYICMTAACTLAVKLCFFKCTCVYLFFFAYDRHTNAHTRTQTHTQSHTHTYPHIRS